MKIQNENDVSAVFSLRKHLAIVTGGGTGLGFGIASCLIAAGARVVITGRHIDILRQAVEELGNNAYAEQHDVTDLTSAAVFVSQVIKKYGAPSILVNNAGVHVKKTVEEHGFDDFRKVLATHVEGAFAMTQAVVPIMKTARKGNIIFIASMSAILGIPNILAYSTAKSAYVGMVRGLATELGPSNIRVNAIAPGWIQSPMLDKALSGDAERKNKILSRTPQQRFGFPREIGWSTVFLCSSGASFINGVVLPVDGGASIGF